MKIMFFNLRFIPFSVMFDITLEDLFANAILNSNCINNFSLFKWEKQIKIKAYQIILPLKPFIL